MTRESGFLLPSMLFVLAVSAVITAAVLSTTWYLQRTWSADYHGSRATVSAHRLLLPLNLSTNQTIACQESIGHSGYIRLEREACILTRPKIIEGAGLVDYDRIFANLNKCKDSYPAKAEALSQGSSRATFTCKIERPEAQFVTDQNIEGRQVETSKKLSTSILVAAGYVSIKELRVNSDLLIIAGGDLKIGTLQSAEGELKHLTIISPTGFVQIEQVRGPVTLFVSAPRGALIPPVKAIPPFPLPPMRNFQALGWFTIPDHM